MTTNMSMVTRSAAAAVLALSLSWLGAGCKKKASDTTSAEAAGKTAAPEATPKLAGSGDVLAAIDAKDYDGAVATLMKIGQSARTDQEKVAFMVLSRDAKMKLTEASATDPKAAQAVKAINLMTLGR